MNSMRVLFILFVGLLLIIPVAFAQQNPEGATASYSLAGKVIDGETKNPLEYATIALMRKADSSIVTGTVTDAKGAFRLETGTGAYLLRIQYLGYQPLFRDDIILSAERPFFRLGEVALSSGVTTIDEVQIQAEKSKMSFELDKKVFNVGKDLTTMGGTAADLLDNIPSVSVDIDGNVSLRGSEGVRVLVNGKPSGLTGANALQQLPPNMIDRVEIITNPSARYEASGTAGIINIILKKDRRQGWNGSFDASAGVPTNHNLAINLNHRREKLNFFGSLGFRYRNTPRNGLEYRETTDENGELSILDQTFNGSRGGMSGSLRFGADYSFNERNILTGSVLYRLSDDLNTSDLEFFFNNGLKQLQYINRRFTEEAEDESGLDYNLSFERTFAKKDQKFTADLVYTSGTEVEDMDAEERDYDANDMPMSSPGLLQHILNQEDQREWVLKADYVQPIGKDGKFEVGYRGNIRRIGTNYLVEEFDEDQAVWENLTNISNDFNYDEDIHGLYSSYGNKLGKLSYQFGLRAEYTHVRTQLIQTNEVNDREYTNLFPSAFFNYEIKTGNAIQVSYSRRVQRPRFWDLNPFFNYTNPLSIRSGNPNLNPEFSDAYEIGNIRYFGEASLSSSIYYRHTDGVITRITTVDSLGVSQQRPENLTTRDDIGAEFSLNVEPFKWWNLTASANIFRGKINGDNLGFTTRTEFFSYSSRFNSKFSLPKNLDLLLMVNYRGPEKTPQGERRSMVFTDMAISKDILKNNATISVRIQDIFNAMRYRYETRGESFYIYREGNWRAQRQITLSFSYRLNQRKKPEREQRNDFGGE